MSPMEQLAERAAPLLLHPSILSIRRNHGLEHATIHILNRQRYKLSGRSSGSGFVLLGDVPTEQVEHAVREALQRMKAGEHQLAIHPNCGTNLATAGFLATTVAFLGFAGRGWRKCWERFPTMMILMIAAALLSTPLGMSLAAALHHRRRYWRPGIGQRHPRYAETAIQRAAVDRASYRDRPGLGAHEYAAILHLSRR